jgi:hypothetical protein
MDKEEKKKNLIKRENDLRKKLNEFKGNGEFSDTFKEYEYHSIRLITESEYESSLLKINSSLNFDSIIKSFADEVTKKCNKELNIDSKNKNVFDLTLYAFIEEYSIKLEREYLKSI